MTKTLSRKKYAWLLVVLIILAVTIGLMYLINNVNNEDQQISNKNNESTQLGIEIVAITENLKSAKELQDFLDEEENKPTPFSTVGNVNKDNINWNTQELVVVEFYIPSGQFVKEITINEQGGITASVLKAPQECMFSGAQVKQIQFLPVLSGQQIIQDKIYVQYVENLESCDQLP